MKFLSKENIKASGHKNSFVCCLMRLLNWPYQFNLGTYFNVETIIRTVWYAKHMGIRGQKRIHALKSKRSDDLKVISKSHHSMYECAIFVCNVKMGTSGILHKLSYPYIEDFIQGWKFKGSYN